MSTSEASSPSAPSFKSGQSGTWDSLQSMRTKIRFPFKLRLGLAIGLLSMGLISGSVYWLYIRLHSGLLNSMASELLTIGDRNAKIFTDSDLNAIQDLDRQIQTASYPITPDQLASSTPTVIHGFRSQAVKERFWQLPIYQQLALKLGAITNESRRDNSSDIFIMDSYLLTAIPESADHKFLRILVDDEGFRYALSTRKQEEVGTYYFPSSHALGAAFSGQSAADSHFHNDPLYGDVITVGVPLKKANGEVVAVLGLNVDVKSLANQIRQLKTTYLHVMGVGLILSVLVAYLLSRWLARPVSALYNAAEQVRQHNFDTKLAVTTHDEFEVLADAFNAMVGEVQHYTNNLEALVSDRTAQLNQAKQEMETDLQKGQTMQRDFLPEPLLAVPGWEIVATFDPAKKVAGDFYDVFLLPGNLVGLVIADVCDKGVGAAMFMGLFRSFIRLFSGQMRYEYPDLYSLAQVEEKADLTQVEKSLRAVEITNNYISKEHSRTGMFATLFFGILDPQTGLLTYINGGHEPLFILNELGIKMSLKPTGPAVGMLPDVRYKLGQAQLDEGDILLGYTDGVTDARSPNQQFFSSKRLMTMLGDPVGSASELVTKIRSAVFAHVQDAAQFDDITMLSIQRQKSL
jgi:serine phosphatase RsbU (regulator of sigma subunit)